MIKFKYYKTDNKFRSDLSTGNKIDSDDIVFVEDSGILRTHDQEWGFVDRINGFLPLSYDWAIQKGDVHQGPTIIHRWPGSNGGSDTYATINFPYLYSGDNFTLATTNDISAAHANDATVTDVQNLSGTTASIDINDFVDAVETVQSAGYVNARLEGSVVYITDKNNVTRSIDLFSTYNEQVYIEISTVVQNVNVSGLQLNIYYDDAIIPSQTVTTDANGNTRATISSGTSYRIEFPVIAGCKPIGDIRHIANLSQRNIEVEYIEDDVQKEQVRVTVKQGVNLAQGVNVTVSYDNDSDTYTTDSSGLVTFEIPIGTTYQISVPAINGYVTPSSMTILANKHLRGIQMRYRSTTSAVLVIDNDENEYTLQQFIDAVERGTTTKENAKLIAIVTDSLVDNNGSFCLKIDDITNRTTIQKKQWCTDSVQFDTIPSNGNNISAAYYYDGYNASLAIQTEATNRSLTVPAITYCLQQSITVGQTTHPGFLGSVGQWNVLWANRLDVDDILDYIQPNTMRLSTLTDIKWTSTQSGATCACSWTSSANFGYGKTSSYVVVPFFAY